MRNQVAQIARVTAEADNEIFFAEWLSPISSVDLKGIRELRHFLPVIVLIPRPLAPDQAAPQKLSLAKSAGQGFETTKLLGVLGKVVGRFKSSSERNTAAFGDVTVNFSTMEAFRKSEPVVLTTKEFQTLRYFIQHAGRVISREARGRSTTVF
jgi:DNA-binding response OmpR family regulator